jgi:phenylpropionate dioxygenase-like ring-hydroxylating dioxygenase large terminal subunit
MSSFCQIPAFFIGATPQWYSHINNNAILEDDQIFLHHQERYLEQSGGSQNFSQTFYLPTKADVFVFEFRQWVNDYQADPFPGQTFPPALNSERLLDRYHSHTENCHSCNAAWQNIQTARKLIAIISLIAWAGSSILALTGSENARVLGLMAIGIVAIGSLSWYGLGRLLMKLERGDRTPARNRKKS